MRNITLTKKLMLGVGITLFITFSTISLLQSLCEKALS